MPVAELSTRGRPVTEQRSLWGWGATARSSSTVIAPRDVQDVVERLCGRTDSVLPVIARGAGRSYGDAAQLDGGDVLDMTGWTQVLSIDRDRATITAQAGATIAQLMAALAARGLTLPVVPGTRQVTLGGAIASDIHGKNHHRDGGLARHVLALSLCTPADGWREVSPETDSELFYATLGGMGLTGVVVQATLRAEPLSSPWVAVDTDRTDGLEQTLAVMAEDERHRYSVAWLDLLARGSAFGRAVVSRADDLPAASAPRPVGALRRLFGSSRTGYPDALLRGPAMVVPRRFPDALLRAPWVRAFNALRLRAAPRLERGRPHARPQYFFPLDVLGEWNRLYGRGGLIQYQLVVPLGQEAALAALLRADPHPEAARVSGGFQAIRRRIWRTAVLSARRLDARDRPARRCAGGRRCARRARRGRGRLRRPRLSEQGREASTRRPRGHVSAARPVPRAAKPS